VILLQVVLTASSDATIRIFSSSTGVNPRTLIGHKRAVTSTAILGVGRNVLSGSKDGSIKLWDVSAGKCVSTMYNKGFVGFEKICQGKSAEKIRELAKRVETGDNDEDYAPRTLEGEIPTDTADKIVFAGLSSGSGLLSAFDLASKKPIFPSFSHIPTSTSVTTNRQGGAIYALAYQPDDHLLASGSAKGIVVVRDTRMISNEKNQALHVFSRSEASINDLTFLKTQRGPELVVAPASGMPYRASLPMSDSYGDVRIVEEFAGWEAVAINSIAVGNGEGNIWVGGSDAGLRRY
jgi:proteasomal ATPase-associated factor 1